jgi:hypothetical protein
VLQLPAAGRRDSASRQLPWLQACQGRAAKEVAAGKIQKHNWKGVLTHLHKTAAVLRGSAPRQGYQVYQEVAASTSKLEPPKTKSKKQEPGQSVPAPAVNSDTPDMLRALIIVQQIMTELKGAVSEEAMIYAITFNVNDISKQRSELSKQLQDLHRDVALFSETHLKPHEGFYIPNYHFHRIDRHPVRKGGTAVTVRKGIPHKHVGMLPLISEEATAVYIPIGNREILLVAVYKSPGRT